MGNDFLRMHNFSLVDNIFEFGVSLAVGGLKIGEKIESNCLIGINNI